VDDTGTPSAASARAGSNGCLLALATLVVVVATLYASFLNLVSFANTDYRWIVIQAVSFSGLATILALWTWRRLSTATRLLVLVPCLAVDAWVLLDAGGRRLPGVLSG